MPQCNLHAPPAIPLFAPPPQWRITAAMDRPAAQSLTSRSEELSALIGAVSRGDRAAFATLYDRTSAKLYGICLRVLRDEGEAQDVLQDAYVTVWNKAARYDADKAGAITWLAVLARNKAIDRLRQRRFVTDDLDAAGSVEDDSPSAFEVVQRGEDAARLADCLGELEERPRAMIRAAFLDGASYPELADREGVPLGTMKSWIRRGLQRLRGCLER